MIPALPRKQVLVDFYCGSFLLCLLAYFFLFPIVSGNWSVAVRDGFGFFSTGISCAVVIFLCAFCALSFLFVLLPLTFIKATSLNVFLLPLAWAIAEVLRSYLFALMSYGPGGEISPNFNWGAVAAAAAGTSLVYSSRYVGFFGLTVLAALINIALWKIVNKKECLRGILLLLTIFSITFSGWSLGQKTGDEKKKLLAVVHLHQSEDIQQWTAWQKLPENIDLLVFPEYSRIIENSNFSKLAQKLNSQGMGITTIVHGRPPVSTNRLIAFDSTGAYIAEQDKTFLVSSGETLPYVLKAIFLFFRQHRALREFELTQSIQPGRLKETPIEQGDLSVGALACSGAIALLEYERLARLGANILVNSASFVFLQSSRLYQIYGNNMARYHAVRNNRPFMQSAMGGDSFILDNQGQVLAKTQGLETQMLTASIDLTSSEK